MPGYVMAVLNAINGGPAFEAYQQVAQPTIGQYGGKRVFASLEAVLGDGAWSPMGVILFEFDGAEKAKKWYKSPEYQAVVNQRINSTDSALVLIGGE